MPRTFKTQRRVEFRDTDMAGIVHFSVFFAYMEEAEHQLLRELGIGVVCDIDGQTVSFPRVAASCNYRSAIKFEDIVDIEISIKRIGTKSVTYSHAFTRDGQPVADGEITAVCCRFDHAHSGKPESIPTPAKIINVLRPYLANPDNAPAES